MCFFGSFDIGTKSLTAPPPLVHRPEFKSDFELRTSPSLFRLAQSPPQRFLLSLKDPIPSRGGLRQIFNHNILWAYLWKLGKRWDVRRFKRLAENARPSHDRFRGKYHQRRRPARQYCERGPETIGFGTKPCCGVS
jgi:hypothetical protein